jgi:multicomponent Na+:H+ antiporter subunit A
VLQLDIFNLETWGILFPVIAWVASVFTFIYSMMIVFKTFGGKLQPEKLPKKPHEAPIGMLISPIILASLVVIFGLFPNLLSQTLIEPAVASIQPSLAGEEFHVHLSLWHGFNPELMMTIGVIIVGIVLYTLLPKWKGVYKIFPQHLSFNRLYDTVLLGSDKISGKITRLFMTGFIRNYLVYILGFFIVALCVSLFVKDAFSIDFANSAPIGLYEVIVAVIVTACSVAMLLTKSRLTAIILLGAVGYTVSIFYVLFRAPDLALTQLVIETISVALFLLCFYHLPKRTKKEEPLTFKLSNALVSLGVGLTVALVAISAHSTKLFDSISSYYLENSYEEAGGKNVVNVILVDFRGLDTMFEITVLGIAALGIYAMVKLRLTRKEKKS